VNKATVVFILGLYFITGCSTLKKMHLRAGLGVEPFVESKYSTTLQNGDLELGVPVRRELGVGYYGFWRPNLNLFYEFTVGGTRSAELADDSFNIETRQGVLEYIFHPEEKRTFVVGLGLGSTGFSLGNEYVDTHSPSWQLRGGWLWNFPKQDWSFYSNISYLKVRQVRLDRFLYFGGAGHIDYESLGVHVGAIYNLF
jgi:hypothetical protein